MALPDRITRPRRGLRGRWRLRRRLAGIAKGLAKDATLAAKFAMFNALTRGEPPSGAEPLRRPGWRPRLPRFGWPLTLLVARSRPARNGRARKPVAWRGRVIAIAAVATVIVGTLLLSSLLPPAARPCLMLASAGTQASASAAPSKAGQPAAATVPGEPVGGFARGPGSTCPAYPIKK
ncbi:MAG TPA: hypothetical protein VFE59_27965 [Trebonia sp.]|jgi:hypothetical protein|nr:hypothetical protein [Trebonia sp.]